MPMSEEEILDKLRKMLFHTQKANECGLSNNDFKEDIEALSGILGLYQKEKEKNKELQEMLKHRIKYTNELEEDLFQNANNYVISKDKIKKLKEKVHEVLDSNGITRAYQLEIDRYFDEILED